MRLKVRHFLNKKLLDTKTPKEIRGVVFEKKKKTLIDTLEYCSVNSTGKYILCELKKIKKLNIFENGVITYILN